MYKYLYLYCVSQIKKEQEPTLRASYGIDRCAGAFSLPLWNHTDE
jgi:hypothetical protein